MKILFIVPVMLVFTLNLHGQSAKNDKIEPFWQPVGKLPDFGTYKYFSILNGNSIAVLAKDKSSSPYLFTSTDLGKTWEKNETPTMNWLWSQLFTDGRNLILIPCAICEPGRYISMDFGKNWVLKNDEIEKTQGYMPHNIDINTRYSKSGYNYMIYECDKFGKWSRVYSNLETSESSPTPIYIGRDREEFLTSIKGTPYEKITQIQGVSAFYTANFDAPIFCSKSVGGGSDLLITYDKGANWNKIYACPDYVTVGGISLNNIFRICNDKTLLANFSRGIRDNKGILGEIPEFCVSNDNGKSWKPVGAPGGMPVNDLLYLPDGTVLVINTERNIYRSSKPIGCKKESDIQFGTTVITHGFQLGGQAPVNKGEWIYEMANTILQKANNKGCIRLYDKFSGNFKNLTDKCPNPNGDGENILMFNWANESNFNSKGYSEAAGDALFSSLLMGNDKKEFDLNNIHFIGHSRGTVVNTLTVERLLFLKNNYPKYAQINIDQVTNLDTHDWGANNISSDIDDAHPEMTIADPIDHIKNNGTIAWKGVNFNDSYYQDNVYLDLTGRRVKGADNYYWDSGTLNANIGHTTNPFGIGIYDVYKQTINGKNLIGGGYHFSRIGNNTSARDSRGIGEKDITFDFYNNLKIQGANVDRVRGIVNGSFDRGYSGWEEHGGTKPALTKISEMRTSLHCEECAKLTISDSLVHNRFYIPINAKSIKFQYKAAKFKNGKLKVSVLDGVTLKEIQLKSIEIIEKADFIEEVIGISECQGNVVKLKFEFITDFANTEYYPQLLIDNVKLSTEGVIGQKKLPLNNENVNRETPKNENANIQITSNAIVIGKLNSNFNTNEGWSTIGGEAIFEKGKVSLKPDKNGTPVKLFSNAFNISANASQLKLKIAKNLVGKGEIKVSLKNVTTNATDDIYSSKINNVVSKIDNFLTNANKVLDGNSNLKKIEPVFEEITIDISKYAGTVVSLEIYFTNTGSSKQPIIIDGITIN